MSTTCTLCQTALVQKNETREHILPNAIGGRRRVKGFICESCNSETGHVWDAALAEWLNPICAFVGIKRQRGPVPFQVVPTLDGGQVILNPDGSQSRVKPELSEKTEGNAVSIHISARNDREARKMARGILRKYPQLRDGNVDDLMDNVVHTQEYDNQPMQLVSPLEGIDIERSLVKSALATAFDYGIDPSQCESALEFLRNDDAKPCWGIFFSADVDLIADRPIEVMFHCVAVRASSETNTVLGT